MALVKAKGYAGSNPNFPALIGEPTEATTHPPYNTWIGSGLMAGESLLPFSPCFVASAADVATGALDTTGAALKPGLVYMAQAVNGKARVDGWNYKQVFLLPGGPNEACTLRADIDVDYIDATVYTTGTGGTNLFLGAVAGSLYDTTTATYGIVPVAQIQSNNKNRLLPATSIRIRRYIG